MTFKKIKAGQSYGDYRDLYNFSHIYMCLEKENDIATFIHFDVNYKFIDIVKINKTAWNATYKDGSKTRYAYGFHLLSETKVNVTPKIAIQHVFVNCNGWKWKSMFGDAIM
jgi:hypothetical protein